MPRNIIILGMARSGTSLTTSIFANQGYYVDEDENITPKNHHNPKGFWESQRLTALNAELLRATGFSHDNTWRYDEITEEQVNALRSMQAGEAHRAFIDEFRQHAPWVWKDPRLSYTLGIWWPLLDQDNTLVLLVRRDPAAIFNSFVRVGWREDNNEAREALFERTRQHIEHARRLLERLQIPFIEIDYAEFSECPDAIAERINAAAGLSLSADDIGYDKRFNHDNAKGRWSGHLDRVADMMPSSLVRTIKRLIPRSILRSLYPERYE